MPRLGDLRMRIGMVGLAGTRPTARRISLALGGRAMVRLSVFHDFDACFQFEMWTIGIEI